jgi:hypothetical protein
MGEIRTVTTLRRKREEIRRTIIAYEERLSQAKADLAHVSAAISIFEGTGEGTAHRPYVDVHRIFAHRELIDLAKRALTEQGPMDTRQIARYILNAKGLDAGDKVLAKAVAYKIVHSLRQQHRRGKIADAGKRGNVRIWALTSPMVLFPTN